MKCLANAGTHKPYLCYLDECLDEATNGWFGACKLRSARTGLRLLLQIAVMLHAAELLLTTALGTNRRR